MVGERGFEPPTPWSRTRCSTRLSHSPTTRAATRQAIHAHTLPIDRQSDYNIAALGCSLPLPDHFSRYTDDAQRSNAPYPEPPCLINHDCPLRSSPLYTAGRDTEPAPIY